MAERSLSVEPASEGDYPTLLAWLNDPAIAGEMDILPPVQVEHLRRALLPIIERDGRADLDFARLYAIRDLGGPLVGFGLSYGWDSRDDPIKEVDFALPGLRKIRPMATWESMVLLAHAVFVHERARELRTHTRPGVGGKGVSRVFTEGIGAEAVSLEKFASPRDQEVGRYLFRMHPAQFYASRGAKRWGITPQTP